MKNKISVVINTYNEEKNIARVIDSVKFADEIIVCDMYSEDKTVQIAKKLGAKVVFHKKVGFVEPARNFAISKASGVWVLILDADEEIPKTLIDKLKDLINQEVDFSTIEIPRKNIIFNKWVKASMWWPDYHPRFFRKGSVIWSEKIHIKPQIKGKIFTLPVEEELAIIHYHYNDISQFIERLNRYTTIEAKELLNSGYKFDWKDLINKPVSEFLGRFFANQGFKDGLHGLILSLLQAFSFLVVYIKVWQQEGFKEQDLVLEDVKAISKEKSKEIDYWFKYGNLSKNSFKSLLQRAKNKLI